MVQNFFKQMKRPLSETLKNPVSIHMNNSELFKQEIKFQLSLFTEDWMKINKEDLKRVFNIMGTCKLNVYTINYYKDTRYSRYDWFEKTTKSGEQTRNWLENIVSDFVWSGFGREAQKAYDKDRFESFNNLIKWIKHVDPFTCINLSYVSEKKVGSYTFCLRNFPKDIPKRTYGENLPTFTFR
jgi:hypothetical protein